MTNINTGSGVRRILFKRQLCMYKSEQRYINENLLTRNARARTHGISLVILKRLLLKFLVCILASYSDGV